MSPSKPLLGTKQLIKVEKSPITRGGDLPIGVGIDDKLSRQLTKKTKISPETRITKSDLKSLPNKQKSGRVVEAPQIISKKLAANMKNESDLIFKPHMRPSTAKPLTASTK